VKSVALSLPYTGLEDVEDALNWLELKGISNNLLENKIKLNLSQYLANIL